MNYKEISDLIKLINKSDLSEFKLKDADFELTIRTKEYGKNKTVLAAPSQQIVPIQSPMSAPFAIPGMMEAVAPAAAPASTDKGETPVVEEESTNYIEVKSPIVGTFYRAPSPDKGPYLKVGDVVNVGDVVCIVEAMKLFNEIESEVSGKVVKVMLEDAQPVEYDQVLFLLDPNA